MSNAGLSRQTYQGSLRFLAVRQAALTAGCACAALWHALLQNLRRHALHAYVFTPYGRAHL